MPSAAAVHMCSAAWLPGCLRRFIVMQDRRAVAAAGEPRALLGSMEELMGLAPLAAAIRAADERAGQLHTAAAAATVQADG